MNQEVSFSLSMDKHSLIEMLTAAAPSDPSVNLAQEEFPEELEAIVTYLLDFMNAATAYESLAPKGATDEEAIKAFAKDPNGLVILDNLQRVRCNLWSQLIKVFLILLEDTNEPEKAKIVTSSNSLKEIAEIFIPNANELITADLIAIKAKLLGKLPTELTDKLFNNFKSILTCQLSGLPDQANMFADNLIKELLTHQKPEMISMREEVLKAIGHIEESSKAGKSGRNKRYAKADKVIAFAINLYNQKNYANPHQAAQQITAQVIEYGESIGYSFSSAYQATKTINSWLSKHKKSQQ